MQTDKNTFLTQDGIQYLIPSGSEYIATYNSVTPSVFHITASPNTDGRHTPEFLSVEYSSYFKIHSAEYRSHKWYFVSSSGNPTISSLGELTLISKFSGSATLFNNMSSSTFVISQSGGAGHYEQLEQILFTLSTSSAAFSYGLDSTDNNSFILSGSSTTKLYFSGSGKIGINTTDPQSGFDVVADEVQFQKPGSRKGLKINNEGNIESFNKDVASAATGSEFILKYSRGTTITQASLDALGIVDEIGDDAGRY
jgi:hypothetical protein